MTDKTVYLIRHAEGFHNVNENYEIVDPVLTDLGKEQAKNRSLELSKINFDVIYVSPLKRTLETANLLFGNVKMKGYEDIREYVSNPCDFRINMDQSIEKYPNIDLTSIDPFDPFFEPETIKKLTERCERVDKLFHNSDFKNIAVVTHYGFINHFMKSIMKIDDIYLDNCNYIRVKY